MDPQRIAAVAAFLTAAAGLASMVLTKKHGWPRIAVVGSIAAAGILLLLIPGSSGDGQDRVVPVEYERRVRLVCSDRAAIEAQVKRGTDELIERLNEGSITVVSLVSETLRIQVEASSKSEELKAQLKALDPPSDREAIHHEAVAIWERLISEERYLTDEFRKRAATDPLAAFQWVTSEYDPSEVRRLDQQVNDSLVRLARSGCHPAA